MKSVNEVKFPTNSFETYQALVGEDRYNEIKQSVTSFINKLGDNTVWHINSTATGGGVAEMLQTMLGYGISIGLNWRWLVISGNQPFFEITKRMHNGLHGSPGDGGSLDVHEHQVYEKVMAQNLRELRDWIKPGDYVVCHDPQTAGLIHSLEELGAQVIWRCHIGSEDIEDQYVDRSWEFLRKYIEDCQGFIFTRKTFAPRWVPVEKIQVVHPSIDAFSPKNQDMEPVTCQGILGHVGIIDSCCNAALSHRGFLRRDGSQGTVQGFADILRAGPPPKKEDLLVVQVSRWDRLKDMQGVMTGFAEHVVPKINAHLVLAGPNVQGVSDDPEGLATYNECVSTWCSLPPVQRSRIQLVCLPMDDVDENAAIVNALQRHANIIIQKSLYEGFGLTVTEALWKGRPVIASAVGGIQDQITTGQEGILIKDPSNLRDMGKNIVRILENGKLAKSLGEQAYRRVKSDFLITRHIHQYMEIFSELSKKQSESLTA